MEALNMSAPPGNQTYPVWDGFVSAVESVADYLTDNPLVVGLCCVGAFVLAIFLFGGSKQ
jgi:hypothetical protein